MVTPRFFCYSWVCGACGIESPSPDTRTHNLSSSCFEQTSERTQAHELEPNTFSIYLLNGFSRTVACDDRLRKFRNDGWRSRSHLRLWTASWECLRFSFSAFPYSTGNPTSSGRSQVPRQQRSLREVRHARDGNFWSGLVNKSYS